MCRVLLVSKAGFYTWCKRPTSIGERCGRKRVVLIMRAANLRGKRRKANVRPSVLFRGPIGGRPSGLLLRTFQEVAEEVVVSLLAPCRAGHHVRSAVYKRVQFRDLHVRTVRHNVCRQRPPDSLERRVGTKPPFDCWTKVIWRDITRIITRVTLA